MKSRSGTGKTRPFIGLIGALACLAGCDPGRGEHSDEVVATVRVVDQPYLSYAALKVAEAEGYFSDEGLRVEFVHAASSEAAVPLLINGSVDVLPGHAAPGLLNTIAQGFPSKLVAITSQSSSAECSSIGILGRPDLMAFHEDGSSAPPVRRISINRQAAMVFIVEELLEHAGLRLDQLEQTYLPHALEPDALASGEIDAALAGEPFLSRTVLAGKGILWVPIEKVLPGFQYSFLFYGPRLLETDRDVGQRFATAYLRALRKLALGKTADNVALVARVTGEDPSVLKQMCWPFNPTDGHVDMESVRAYQRWLVDRGLQDAIVPDDDLWDRDFTDEANRILDLAGGDG